jgi:hypothetical protein
MTQAIDLTVATLQESVRHNEKNIDKIDRDLKDFRSEVIQRFEKVDDQFNQLEAKVDQRINQLEAKVDKINDRFNQTNMLLLAIVGLVITLIVKLIAFS